LLRTSTFASPVSGCETKFFLSGFRRAGEPLSPALSPRAGRERGSAHPGYILTQIRSPRPASAGEENGRCCGKPAASIVSGGWNCCRSRKPVTIQVGTARRAVHAASSGAKDCPPDASARRPYLNSYENWGSRRPVCGGVLVQVLWAGPGGAQKPAGAVFPQFEPKIYHAVLPAHPGQSHSPDPA
jgi:hypothetical protein